MQLDPQISPMDPDYQGMLHFGPFTYGLLAVTLICNSL